jgi:hypothetical protein
VTVRANVTAVQADGFYCQDAVAIWSGVYVYTGGDAAALLATIEDGDEARRRRAVDLSRSSFGATRQREPRAPSAHESAELQSGSVDRP